MIPRTAHKKSSWRVPTCALQGHLRVQGKGSHRHGTAGTAARRRVRFGTRSQSLNFNFNFKLLSLGGQWATSKKSGRPTGKIISSLQPGVDYVLEQVVKAVWRWTSPRIRPFRDLEQHVFAWHAVICPSHFKNTRLTTTIGAVNGDVLGGLRDIMVTDYTSDNEHNWGGLPQRTTCCYPLSASACRRSRCCPGLFSTLPPPLLQVGLHVACKSRNYSASRKCGSVTEK